MRLIHYLLIGMALAAALTAGSAWRSAAARPDADIVLTNSGCTATLFTLPATHEPWVAVRNDAAQAMVFTLPQLDKSITLPPGEQGRLELPRYIMGEFPSFCLTAQQHSALGGDNPFLCVLEPQELAPVALSSGRFIIAPHERIKEITAS